MIKSYELIHIKIIITWFTSVLRDKESIQSKLLSLKVSKRDRERFKKDDQILIIKVTKFNVKVKLAALIRENV